MRDIIFFLGGGQTTQWVISMVRKILAALPPSKYPEKCFVMYLWPKQRKNIFSPAHCEYTACPFATICPKFDCYLTQEINSAEKVLRILKDQQKHESAAPLTIFLK
jgi:hypothetical protein